jgi:hypothetical protein
VDVFQDGRQRRSLQYQVLNLAAPTRILSSRVTPSCHATLQ